MANTGLESRRTPPYVPLDRGDFRGVPHAAVPASQVREKDLDPLLFQPTWTTGTARSGWTGTLRTLETRDGAHSPPCSSPALPFLQRELAMQRPFETPHRPFAVPPRRPGNPHRMPSARWFHESRPGWRRCATPFRY